MCMHIFLFLLELRSYVTSFIVGAIVVPFKYIGNKTFMIFTRCTTLIFFTLSLVTYTEYLRFIKLLLCGDVEINPGPFSRCKFISFYHWNLNGLLARNREKFHLLLLPQTTLISSVYQKRFLIYLFITFMMG